MGHYIGVQGAAPEHERLFACPADTFYFDHDQRIPQSLHRQPHNSHSSYAFNAGNSLPGNVPTPRWPGIAGRKLGSIREPARTILVTEFPALAPYSWHEPAGASHFNDARNVVSFVDGHVSYTKMYWNATDVRTGHNQSWHYDPPAGYAYKWSSDYEGLLGMRGFRRSVRRYNARQHEKSPLPIMRQQIRPTHAPDPES